MELKLKAILATLVVMMGITLVVFLIVKYPPLLIYFGAFFAIWYIAFIIYTFILDVFKEMNKK